MISINFLKRWPEAVLAVKVTTEKVHDPPTLI
jgi:hypothetical protein